MQLLTEIFDLTVKNIKQLNQTESKCSRKYCTSPKKLLETEGGFGVETALGFGVSFYPF